MITTVTMNPSIDIAYTLDELRIDQVNRVKTVNKTAGGKGLNVARVLHLLADDVLATGLVGGQHGAYIKEQLDQSGIKHQFLPIKGETRDSIAILHGVNQTELLESGPVVTEEEQHKFTEHFARLMETTDIFTISGSLPQGFSKSYYAELLAFTNKKGKRVLLATSGQTLLEVLEGKEKPFLIKPNLEELGELVHQTISSATSLDEIQSLLDHPLFEGINWIVLSLGAKGAIAKVGGHFYQVTIPKIAVVNPVGSGDSTIAGLAHALSKSYPIEETLAFAMACGMANAQQEKTGWIDPVKVDYFRREINVRKIR